VDGGVEYQHCPMTAAAAAVVAVVDADVVDGMANRMGGVNACLTC
jgi:hypothetical protein